MTTFDCSELCRLCLVKDRVKVPIFEGEGDARQVSFKIGTCLPIKVTREDRFPKQVCEDCINKLDLVYDFWTTTVNSERQLSQWVGDAGDGEDKQGYVSITDELMKQETAENRLMEGSVMNQNDQNTNININMMDQMGLTMPIIISNNQQQQQQQHQQMTMQGVSGTSSDANQRGNKRHHEEVEASDDEGDIEGLDNDDAVKSEDIDGTSNRPTGHEPTFVSIACDDGAGPSGLQQQKMDMSDMIMTQADVDPKSGSSRKAPRRDPRAGHQCTKCSARFPHVMKLVEHLKNMHHITNAFSCDECGKTFRSPVNIPRHKLIHRNEKRFACDLCDYKANQKVNLESHKRRHSRDFPFHCETCDRGFMANSELVEHRKIHEGVKYTCEKCGRSYGYRKNYLAHMRTHNVGEKPARRSRKKYEEVLCETCGTRLSSKNALIGHMKMHNNVKDEECDTCGKKFSSRSNLAVHMRSHTGVKPYKCHECNKEFTQRTTLVVHMRYHTDERPYMCGECGKGFVTKTKLHDHINKTHSMS